MKNKKLFLLLLNSNQLQYYTTSKKTKIIHRTDDTLDNVSSSINLFIKRKRKVQQR